MSYATPEELAAALRLPVTDANRPGLQSCIDAAGNEIDAAVDWSELLGAPVGDDVPALVHVVCLARATEWWKASDVAFGIMGFPEIGAMRAPRDGFARHADALLPVKEGFGVA